jgi:predicted enzyme related to lactoylglutathione lyase
MFQGLRTVKYGVVQLEEAKAWYTKVLGFGPYFDQPFYVGFNVGGYELGLDPDAPVGVSGPIAYWGVADAYATYQQLLEWGAQAHSPITDVGDNILIGAVVDPFGNILGVIQNPNFSLPT